MSSLRKISPYATVMAARKTSHKLLNYRQINRTIKSPIFSTVAFAAIFFLTYSDSIISNLSVYPADIRITDIFESHGSEDAFDEQPSEKVADMAAETQTGQTQVQSSTATSTAQMTPPQETNRRVEEKFMPIVITQESLDETSRSLFTMKDSSEENSRPLLTSERVQENSQPLLTAERVQENSQPLVTAERIQENSQPLVTAERIQENSQPLVTAERIQESSQPLVTAESINEEEGSETPDPLIPPKDVTREERIAWFREKLPELQILKSTDLSQKFHGRVLEFFNKQCAIQFFMVWLSPARSFGPREFLAADTLMKANPQACLMIISRSLDTGYGYKILKPLLDRGYKVLAVTPDLPFLVKDTPAEAWLEGMKSGTKDPGQIPLSNNLSNLIRLAMLYKYGGVYLDTDFIILKDFQGLRNAVGAQSIDQVTKKWNRLNGAVMIFDIGHPILVDFLREFALTFDGNKWGHNGPYLVSRVIQRVGDTPGYDLTIMRPRAFYPLDWIKILRLFKKPETEEETQWVEDMTLQLSSGSYAIHLWNKRTRALAIEEGSVMEKLIAENCAVCQNNYNS